MVAAAASLALLAGLAPGTGASGAEGDRLQVAALFAGNVADSGFMQSGYEGAVRATEEFGLDLTHLDGVQPTREALEQALRQLAAGAPDVILAHGGQNNEAAAAVAADHPEITFVVTQGAVTGPNLASYEVLQEESAWLAGAAAGMLTETDVVGHMSGIRVTPGLKGRAAYAAGVAYVNPDATLLTNFSGTQDDVNVARRVAKAEIRHGADIIFTMLNAGRPGVTQAIETSRGDVRQIGNVIDHTAIDPEVFVASAVANSGQAAYQALADIVRGEFVPGVVETIGLEDPDAVRLALADDVPAAVRERLADLAAEIMAGDLEVPTTYDGPEFEPFGASLG